MQRRYFVYLLANQRNGTLYVGVTNDLARRIYEHRLGKVKGFTQKYGLKQLVYFEEHGTALDAITREKQIKAGSRKNKLNLIEGMNPEWNDLYESIL